MKMKPKLKCEACYGQEKVYRIMNHNICLCADCIKRLCPKGSFTLLNVENGITYGNLYIDEVDWSMRGGKSDA